MSNIFPKWYNSQYTLLLLRKVYRIQSWRESYCLEWLILKFKWEGLPGCVCVCPVWTGQHAHTAWAKIHISGVISLARVECTKDVSMCVHREFPPGSYGGQEHMDNFTLRGTNRGNFSRFASWSKPFIHKSFVNKNTGGISHKGSWKIPIH